MNYYRFGDVIGTNYCYRQFWMHKNGERMKKKIEEDWIRCETLWSSVSSSTESSTTMAMSIPFIQWAKEFI